MSAARLPYVATSWWYSTAAADQALLRAARGPWQRDVAHRGVRLSLAHLQGKAKRYGARYRDSLDNLLARAGVVCDEALDRRGCRIALVHMPNEPAPEPTPMRGDQ